MLIENEVAEMVFDAAIAVHRGLGPGLFESVYEGALELELAKRGRKVERQVAIPAVYDGLSFGEAFRADILVDRTVLVEIKSVEAINPVHLKQVRTYLRLTNLRLGLLINFGGELLHEGFRRVANNLPNDRTGHLAPRD